MSKFGNKETAEYLRAGQDVCANCGKYYDEHLLWDGNKCELSSINGWFPKRLADAFTESMKAAPEPSKETK